MTVELIAGETPENTLRRNRRTFLYGLPSTTGGFIALIIGLCLSVLSPTTAGGVTTKASADAFVIFIFGVAIFSVSAAFTLIFIDTGLAVFGDKVVISKIKSKNLDYKDIVNVYVGCKANIETNIGAVPIGGQRWVAFPTGGPTPTYKKILMIECKNRTYKFRSPYMDGKLGYHNYELLWGIRQKLKSIGRRLQSDIPPITEKIRENAATDLCSFLHRFILRGVCALIIFTFIFPLLFIILFRSAILSLGTFGVILFLGYFSGSMIGCLAVIGTWGNSKLKKKSEAMTVILRNELHHKDINNEMIDPWKFPYLIKSTLRSDIYPSERGRIIFEKRLSHYFTIAIYDNGLARFYKNKELFYSPWNSIASIRLIISNFDDWWGQVPSYLLKELPFEIEGIEITMKNGTKQVITSNEKGVIDFIYAYIGRKISNHI